MSKGGNKIPYVNIKLAKDGITAEKKAELIKGVTQILTDLLGKDPQATMVIIEEIETDNWGKGGETLTQLRQKT